MLKAISIALTVALAACATPSRDPSPAPSAPAATAVNSWAADVRLLREELPRRHVNPFTKVSRDQWIWEAQALEADVLAGTLQSSDAYFRLCQLVASLGDGHTRVATMVFMHEFPFSLYAFVDGPVVTAAAPDHADLLGLRLLRIGETPYDQAAPKIATLFPVENGAMAVTGVPRWANRAEGLVYLGLIDDLNQASFTFADSDGRERTVILSSQIRGSASDPAWRTAVPEDRWRITSRLRHHYSFDVLPDHKAISIRYDSCANDPRRPFGQFVKDVRSALDESQARRVIIDLRTNGGGDSAVIAPLVSLIRSRPELKRRGSVIVLIGHHTYSSAQLNAIELQRSCRAVLIGQPTGQRPNAFGEVRFFTLPYTDIRIQYSTRRFHTAPHGTDPESTFPDIEIATTSAEYLAGRDPVLEAALALPFDR